ncbi:MAG: carbon storage regulator CsrA [Oscillospiraceae bacterium]|jgi:carbon storage regulator|nr:carbon storage regulator CsrA [Oscillospiraceae bacterium]
MLVLSRKINETLRIGDNVRVTVLGIDGGTVKLGIDAPRSLSIVREELIKQTESANKEAVTAPAVFRADAFRTSGRTASSDD